MSRLRSTKVCIVALWFVLFNSVNSITYKVSFDPNKMLKPCKNTKYMPLQEFVDTSHVDMIVASDNTLFVQGTYNPLIDIPKETITISTTLKQKLRGRWIDLPYTNSINDLCKDYFKKGTFWNDNITQYFVGDQRTCPPLKDLPLPVNFTLSLNLDFTAPMPDGEYMSRSIVKCGNLEACFEFYADLRQA